MTIERAPLLASLDPDTFTEGTTSGGTSSTNALYSKYADGRIYATQRPAVVVKDDPDDAIESTDSTHGRGLYYWNVGVGDYFVKEDKIYRGNYDTPLSAAFNASADNKDKVFITEVGDYLIFVNPEGNEAYYINASNLVLATKITDGDFPGNIAGKQLVGGAVSLDGYLFVMTDDGTIYNSDLNDPTSWNELGFIGSDISGDNGVSLVKHHNHVCAIGTNSIEFFFNAGNPVGSPLQRRQDIFHLTGAVDYNVVTEIGDTTFFLGRAGGDSIGLYSLIKFQITLLTTDTINSYIDSTYISQSATAADMSFWLSSTWIGEHLLCFMTSMDEVVDHWEPIQTNVYDHTTNLWSTFVSELTAVTGDSSVDAFGVTAISKAGITNETVGQIMFASGTVVKISLSDTVDTDTNGTPQTYNIALELVTPEVDFDTMTDKFLHRLSVVGNTLEPSTNLTPLGISWSNDRYKTFSTAREMDTGFRRSLTRCGKFKRRAFKLTYAGVDRLRLEQLELDVRISGYA